MSTNLGTIEMHATKEIAFEKGRYLLHFSQNGAWAWNGLAYLDLTGYTAGSYFSWICNNFSDQLTVTVTTNGLTITSKLDRDINITYTCLKKY